MIKAHKRTPNEKLEILKRLAKNHAYGFGLVGEKIPDMSLTELGGTTLENYYKEQALAKEYKPHFEHKNPNLQNYCCLLTYKTYKQKYTKNATEYLTETDKKHAMETVIILDAIVDKELDMAENIKKSKSLADTEKQNAMEKIYMEVVGCVRAISTISSTDFEPWSKEKRNKKLKEDAEKIIAFYDEAGAIKKY